MANFWSDKFKSIKKRIPRETDIMILEINATVMTEIALRAFYGSTVTLRVLALTAWT